MNTSNALTILYEVLKDDINDATKKELVRLFDTVLSLDLLKDNDKQLDAKLENYILDMIEKRKIAKENNDYEFADKIRNELLSKGIIIKDTRDGTIYEENS